MEGVARVSRCVGPWLHWDPRLACSPLILGNLRKCRLCFSRTLGDCLHPAHGREKDWGSWPLLPTLRDHLTPPKYSPAFWAHLKIPLIFPKAPFLMGVGRILGVNIPLKRNPLQYSCGERLLRQLEVAALFLSLNLVIMNIRMGHTLNPKVIAWVCLQSDGNLNLSSTYTSKVNLSEPVFSSLKDGSR